ncbi:MAG TPA: homoserine dehydrogenase [Spirochaetota bacterium]|nr:homoserine dehydrogenase [Spirochaetota bacterium]HOM38331.1 homoserine dehydrogenase [Spirochaetota bacterium]HPQ48451.1 homoserine dehydrogenase [Spirochaetota bacterium]
MKKIKFAIIGSGTIGGGVVDLFVSNIDIVKKKTGINFELSLVVDLDDSKLEKPKNYGIKVSKNYKDAIKSDVDIIVELVGGIDFAWNLYNEAILNGKHFVTANKALIADRIYQMFKLARENKKYIGFEASVAGGIPIIKTIKESLLANKIECIEGIINGTTNYILTKMHKEKISFKEALLTAQKLGFAEADPTLDINGTDAASKIAILAAISSNQNIGLKDVYVEGINDIEFIDIKEAEDLGYVIKLIAMFKIDENNNIEIRVNPTLVSLSNPLANINNEYNAVLVAGDFVGKTMYYGRGAGARPTASAVFSDIIDIGNKIAFNKEYNPNLLFIDEENKVKSHEEIYSKYYLRLITEDKVGILAKIAKVMGDNNISISSLIQRDIYKKDGVVPLVFTTHIALEKDFFKAIELIKGFNFVKEIVYYRIID